MMNVAMTNLMPPTPAAGSTPAAARPGPKTGDGAPTRQAGQQCAAGPLDGGPEAETGRDAARPHPQAESQPRREPGKSAGVTEAVSRRTHRVNQDGYHLASPSCRFSGVSSDGHEDAGEEAVKSQRPGERRVVFVVKDEHPSIAPVQHVAANPTARCPTRSQHEMSLPRGHRSVKARSPPT